ncbi:phytanoyl-CoA dioxygenase family protein [Roseobacter sp. YSTF-M11]|uniref:Phytanoyl-CoA dioxygenase family protein n=1 Tax=Roseobacter insulae TaxID=2859783 RepID=A0A9X1K0H9_9RHOB|nr:phytanoyl-CoA dioxygenase family protein [Roseobacter insulae]MBW4706483.1 phytanoyl-CoA dioxygenase family protein [Roseobacter insulae]
MLSYGQKRTFETDGYLVLPDIVPQGIRDAVMSEYAALLDDLCAAWQAEGRLPPSVHDEDFWGKLLTAYQAGCDWFQPMDISLPGDEIDADTPMHFGPAVFDLVTCPMILDVVEALIGPEITSNPIQHIRIKPPRPALKSHEVRAHVTQTDWHQDRGVGLEEADATEMVTVWIAMTDATLDNGCLQVLPGSGQKMLPHCPKTQTAIADGFIEEADAVPLPVPAGGIVILHPMTPHASLPNGTHDFRWSFDLRYNVSGQPTGRAHFPDFVARSAEHPDRVLTDWRQWRQMWEDTRQRLAGQSHIPIHRWQSDAPFCA